MRKHRGTALILAGLTLFFAAGGLAVYNYADDSRASSQSAAVLDALAEAITQNAEEKAAEAAVPAPADAVPEMATVVKDGNEYIGVIEIPSLDITLPVLADWSYEKLKISPCRYTGSYYTDDFVICAHNYRSHFNGLRWVDMGAEVLFTTADGVLYRYVIVNRETLQPNENEAMTNPDADWDLTLFTCYIGGATRCTIRCQRVQDTAPGAHT